MTKLVQVDLQSDNRHLTCWVEPKVKVGDVITLKNHDEPNLRWEVLRVGHPQDISQINRVWGY